MHSHLSFSINKQFVTQLTFYFATVLLLLRIGTEGNRIQTALLWKCIAPHMAKALYYWLSRYYWGHIGAVKTGRSPKICLTALLLLLYCPSTALSLLLVLVTIDYYKRSPELALPWWYLSCHSFTRLD